MKVVKYNDIEWEDPHVERGEPSRGLRRQTVVQGECGFVVGTNHMPPGHRVAPHKHNADELLVILEGGAKLDNGETVGPKDLVLFPANHVYGFTVGEDGLRFTVIRSAETDIEYVQPDSQH